MSAWTAVADPPLDRLIDLADGVTDILWMGAGVAGAIALILAGTDLVERWYIRKAFDQATALLKKVTDDNPPGRAELLAGVVEFNRSLAGPAESANRRSRALPALLAAAALLLAAALVPLFETALIANHCEPSFAPAAEEPTMTASPGPPSPEPGDKNDRKGKAGPNVGAGNGNSQIEPTPFYPPDCGPRVEQSPE